MIETRNLSAGYGKREILHGITANFRKGRVTAIVGPNGCGKTTLLKTIAGILPLRSGEVLADGNSIPSMKAKNRAKTVAYLAQNGPIPEMTAGELVLHGRFAHTDYPHSYTDRDRAAAADAMERMHITYLARERLDHLSGGMRQTAYIAMVLAQDAAYILLDEPTASLDIAHRLQVMAIMRSLAEDGRGVITVLHDLTLAMEFADEIAVMRDGCLLLQATPDAVYESSVIREVFGAELRKTCDGGWYYAPHGKSI